MEVFRSLKRYCAGSRKTTTHIVQTLKEQNLPPSLFPYDIWHYIMDHYIHFDSLPNLRVTNRWFLVFIHSILATLIKKFESTYGITIRTSDGGEAMQDLLTLVWVIRRTNPLNDRAIAYNIERLHSSISLRYCVNCKVVALRQYDTVKCCRCFRFRMCHDCYQECELCTFVICLYCDHSCYICGRKSCPNCACICIQCRRHVCGDCIEITASTRILKVCTNCDRIDNLLIGSL